MPWMKHPLPIQWDEEHPGDWVCWGAIGPKVAIQAASAKLAASLDTLGTAPCSRPPRLLPVRLQAGLEMICYSNELFSCLGELDRKARSREGSAFERWLREASSDSTIVDVRAYSCGESYWGDTATIWRKGKIIWRGSCVGAVDRALDFLLDPKVEAEMLHESAALQEAAQHTKFRHEYRILEAGEHGRVLEFVLTGAIPHQHPRSPKLYQHLSRQFEEAVARERPAAVILNLLGFHYSFGNEIGTILLAPYTSLARSGGGKIAIVATGQTAASLDGLLKSGHLHPLFGRIHPDTQAALSHMTSVPAAKTRP